MKAVSYSSVVGSLMYAQVCTHPNITFVVGILGRYLSDHGQSHWKTAKEVLRYLQGTDEYPKYSFYPYVLLRFLVFFFFC